MRGMIAEIETVRGLIAEAKRVTAVSRLRRIDKTRLICALSIILTGGCQTPQPIPRCAPLVVPSQIPSAASASANPVPELAPDVEIRTASGSATNDQKTRAVLIVQGHGGSAETTLFLQQIGDWVATALGAGPFAVVNPHDVIGIAQNVGPWGENMPIASATSLAEQLGAEVLITASVSDVHVRKIAGTDPGAEAVADLTLSAKAVPGGESLASVNVTARSSKQLNEADLRSNAGAMWSAVAKEAAFAAVPAFQEKWAGRGHSATIAPVRVHFSANVGGADLRIDGTSRGTLGAEPLELAVSPGVHSVEIVYPGMVPFKSPALFRDGAVFAVSLVFTPEAAAAAKQDALFSTLLDRARKSGLTDDLVREIVARGYDRYLSASHTRLDGMPQTLGIGGDAPSLGLAPVATESPSPVPTTNDLLDRAKDASR